MASTSILRRKYKNNSSIYYKISKNFGFNINDEVFAENSWYFRNSLVRANYKNFEKNVFEDTSFLEKFFYNLLTNCSYELKNRYTHIDNVQSANENNLKGNNCTLEEQAIINILKINPATNQEEIAKQINKSVLSKHIWQRCKKKD